MPFIDVLTQRVRHMAGLLMFTASGAFCIAVTEVVLRLSPTFYARLSLQSDMVSTRSHAVYGWKGEPASPYSWAHEGRSSGRLNSAGWRDVEHVAEKKDGVRRVLVLGDSFVEALQVDLKYAFPRLLEAELVVGCRGQAFEVLAMGKNGYGTAQELLVYRHEGRLYRPDATVLLLTLANDLVDNSRRLATQDGARPLSDNGLRKPYFDLRDGRLALDESFKERPAFREDLKTRRDWLRIDNVLRAALRRLRNPAPTAATMAAVAPVGLDEPWSQYQMLRKPLLPAWEEAVSLTERLLSELAADVERDGGRLLVAAIPLEAQLGGVRSEDARLDPFQPQRRLERWARGSRADFLSLLEPLRELPPERPAFGFGKSLGKGHFNQDGHRAVARALARRLSARLCADR